MNPSTNITDDTPEAAPAAPTTNRGPEPATASPPTAAEVAQPDAASSAPEVQDDPWLEAWRKKPFWERHFFLQQLAIQRCGGWQPD